MEEFFNSLTSIEKMFLGSALIGGAMFLFRTVMLIFGAHGHGDMSGGHDFDAGHGDMDAGHADMSHDGDASHDASQEHGSDSTFRLLSFQGLTGFFMMFGLVGLALSKQTKVPELWSIGGASLAGFFTMWIIAIIFVSMKKLQSDGTFKMTNVIGQEGTVYLTIPANGGTGQVQLTVNDRFRIFDATSISREEIPTGDRVKVLQLSGNTMIVTKI